MSRAKHWCFTYNNPDESAFVQLVQPLVDQNVITYLVFGRETGANGTPHLQGYVEFAERKRLRQLRELLGPLHFERRKGTPAQASAYCQKDGDFQEFGELSAGQGTRTDLDAIKSALDSGATAMSIADSNFGSWVRYHKSFEVYADNKRANTRRDVRVVFISGPPGTGKTGIVFTLFPDVWLSSFSNLKWFDGYQGQDVVCLDDYRGDASDSDILRILDIYPLRVPVKGSTVPWLPTRIFITSNLEASQLHTNVQAAFLRRIHAQVQVNVNLDFEDAATIDFFKGKLII